VFSPLILLAIWELAAQTHRIDTRFFPAPSAVFRTAGGMIQTGELWSNLSISLARIAIGFTIGAVPAVIVGLAMGLSSPVRALIQPLIDALFPIPKIAILPLFILIFGIGESSKYAIIAVAVTFLVVINTVAGVRNIERVYLDVGRNFRASRLMIFTDIALPGALPLILTGLKLGMGVALLVLVSAELVGAKSGIGFMLWQSYQVFQIEKTYVWLLVSAILGFVSAVSLSVLERVLVPWKR
jgi:NitT/TauT family transport system permease protein